MKKARIRKIARNAVLAMLALILLVLLVRAAGQAVNRRTPRGGINESMYVDINGSRQWLSIYGEDRDNPVLLYLHGGPGSSTSAIDYAFTRKWADVYTVVTWDQRNCGKSLEEDGTAGELTYEVMMDDGLAATEFLLEYLDREKITLLGHSWGTYFGCNLVLAYPEYYDCYIGTGQLVDMHENEAAFLKEAAAWADDAESRALLEKITPDHPTREHFDARNLLMKKYGYEMMKDGTDYSVPLTVLFNPYYSLLDWFRYLRADPAAYMDFTLSEEFDKFSLKGRTEYAVPFYNINGDCDYQTHCRLAQAYFDEISAPCKKLYTMEDTSHGLLMSKSEAFSEILHEIAAEQR